MSVLVTLPLLSLISFQSIATIDWCSFPSIAAYLGDLIDLGTNVVPKATCCAVTSAGFLVLAFMGFLCCHAIRLETSSDYTEEKRSSLPPVPASPRTHPTPVTPPPPFGFSTSQEDYSDSSSNMTLFEEASPQARQDTSLPKIVALKEDVSDLNIPLHAFSPSNSMIDIPVSSPASPHDIPSNFPMSSSEDVSGGILFDGLPSHGSITTNLVDISGDLLFDYDSDVSNPWLASPEPELDSGLAGQLQQLISSIAALELSSSIGRRHGVAPLPSGLSLHKSPPVVFDTSGRERYAASSTIPEESLVNPAVKPTTGSVSLCTDLHTDNTLAAALASDALQHGFLDRSAGVGSLTGRKDILIDDQVSTPLSTITQTSPSTARFYYRDVAQDNWTVEHFRCVSKQHSDTHNRAIEREIQEREDGPYMSYRLNKDNGKKDVLSRAAFSNMMAGFVARRSGQQAGAALKKSLSGSKATRRSGSGSGDYCAINRAGNRIPKPQDHLKVANKSLGSMNAPQLIMPPNSIVTCAFFDERRSASFSPASMTPSQAQSRRSRFG
ncbi:hypothetical protein BXZ70DRAFT_209903 [Cristinia sonorae]|uniref:Uncharacterized protein n=1 Tax=Cristinia sonorae TaxID=1940300 RepID=A0A8K0UNY1_9AGAR|nr:hypothetical protein BXZ70DRAFT_209903 [Cristinia sonorae]